MAVRMMRTREMRRKRLGRIADAISASVGPPIHEPVDCSMLKA